MNAGEAVLGVVMPAADAQAGAGWYKAFFPRAAYVYNHHGQFWLTARWLQAHGAFTMPDDAREMIEFVYAEDAGERIPTGLQHNAATAEGDAMADRSMAAFNSLSLDSVMKSQARTGARTKARLRGSANRQLPCALLGYWLASLYLGQRMLQTTPGSCHRFRS